MRISSISLISAGVLLVALFSHGRDILRDLFAIPLWISLVVVVAVGICIRTVIRADKAAPRQQQTGGRHIGLHQLSFTTSSAWSAVLTRQVWEETSTPAVSVPLHRSAGKALNTRLDSIFALIRTTFILPWYTRISPSAAFPTAVETLVRQTLAEIVGRAETVDWSTVMVSRILPLVTDHIRHFRTVEHLASTSAAAATLPLPLPTKSHPALSQQAHVSLNAPLALVEAHFRPLLDRILGQSIPEAERSDIVVTIVREVVLGSVLLPVFEMMCDSDFWNRQIDEKGGRYLHEQKQVNKFLSALSNLPNPNPSTAGDSKANSPVRARTLPPATSITASSSTKHFETFLRSIPKVKTIGEARRLRADIDREQRLAKASMEQLLQSDIGDKEIASKRAKKYVKRLDRARIEIDARIMGLSRHASNPAQSVKSPDVINHSAVASITLVAVLSDPSSLAYWLEYMERRGRSLLVQFWLTVEGFKDPLEDLGASPLSGTLLSTDKAATTNGTTAIEDLSFLHATYLSNADPMLNIPAKYVQTVSDVVLCSQPINVDDIRRAKQAVYGCQQAVFDQMEDEDWGGFRKSELFIKATADLTHRHAEIPTSPQVPQHDLLPAIPKHRRQHTAPPLPTRRSSNLLSPQSKPLPSILGRHIAPATPATPAAALSISPPIFDRRSTDLPPPISRQLSGSEPCLSISTTPLPTTPPSVPRRSSQLDFLIGESTVGEDRGKLFGDEEDEEEDAEEFEQIQRMEAIQAALNEIIASDDLASSRHLPPPPRRRTPDAASPSSSFRKPSDSHEPLAKIVSRSVEDLRSSQIIQHPTNSAPQSRKPSNRPTEVVHRKSLDNLSQKPSKHLFDDENETIGETKSDDEDAEDENGFLQVAIPGDIELSVEIARLQEKIQELVKQEHLLDTLIRQAELTGNQTELKILQRSHSSLRREQRTVIFQKAQFEQQEEENKLIPGRTKVTIPSSVVTTEDSDNGKQIVRYTIEVKQFNDESLQTAGWVVARRYNDFWELDKALRERIGFGEIMHGLQDLPPKRLVTNMSSSFVDTRRQGLEKYLQSLVSSPALCGSHLLRTFLSRSAVTIGTNVHSSHSGGLASLAPHNIVKSLYKTMATSLDDSLLGPNMLDLMYSTLNRNLTDFGGLVGLGSDELATFLPQALKGGWSREALSPGSSTSVNSPMQPLVGESGLGSFTAPICDLFIEVFDLKENNWLRRQAIVVILQQFLGSTIERKVRDTFKSTTSFDSLERLLAGFQETLWPEGIRRAPSTPRGQDEIAETRQRAGRKLGLLIPDVAANMIGRGNARRAARRVFGVLQDKRLNQHLMLCIMDEILGALLSAVR